MYDTYLHNLQLPLETCFHTNFLQLSVTKETQKKKEIQYKNLKWLYFCEYQLICATMQE